ncbi:MULTISPECIES: NADH:ubiquinone reductase (Na(+)-transporting) subunit D [Fervidobacterium]|uniref:NADH:ubiquinone oxidoreductase, subunit D n=1 Tax=Fervidobacterium nodosum (strain ATCC 35602 / DSM 5306 / Rt17-B1) TaxID=381764 RepID=A7HKQ3_FERNB|nr:MULTISPECIES: NADH:ubiquinone reductase (Na(+)-transporting) subunit D [Fervidobacterium]ABS60486.1 NADH:ubiquinone oxidoreductase, subunit D [Fervidobacterium nodosum Rt17-B1]KAF2962549.1 NADH:ubiquinone oxidoreductase [Fervidobacterium sp. 2310opik-2]PHJ14530.1 NADH:ubiquinone oxidoreductase [Fervidobacterium sp. SC_NGM5_G05]
MANSAEYKKIWKNNIWLENPVIVQILGICSTLAVTNNLRNTLIMTIGVTLVTAFSNFTISAIRNVIPRKVRMITQVLVISFYVIIVDIILRAYVPDVSKALGPYVGLIITNCIIMGRAEAFAQGNTPVISFWDGFTAGLGYMLILVIVALFRELLGFGTVLGFRVLPSSFPAWTIMVMPPSAFFVLASLIWVIRGVQLKKASK